MLEEFLKNISNKYKPDKVILFGSHAWGEPGKNSDYDVLVVMNSDENKASKRASKMIQDCHPGNISIDLLVRTPAEIQKRLEMKDPFILKIMNQGKTIYERNS
jgi:uncharacterized protein